MELPVFRSFKELLDLIRRCVGCCAGDYLSYHCPLCPVSKYKPRQVSKVKRHLEVHWRTRLETIEGKFAVVCHQDHGTSGGHFHCPSCKKTIKRKENARLHIAKCSKRKGGGYDEKAEVTQDEKNNQSEHSYSQPAKEPQDTSIPLTKKPCPICKKCFHPRWLKNHMKTHKRKKDEINENRHHFTVLVDPERGIFCSAINLSGPPHPVHVIKRTSGSVQESFCDNNTCIDMKETARRGGNPAFECHHVRSTTYAVKGKSIALREESLNRMQSENFMSKERCTQMQTFIETTNDGSPFLVELPTPNLQSDRFIYLSIATGQKRYWCKTGRTVVTIDKQQKSFSCQCSEQSKYCIHKAVGKWFACQEIPHTMSSRHTIEQLDEEFSDSNPDLLCMFEYIYSAKKIPEQIPKEVCEENAQQDNWLGSPSRKLYPIEDTCHRCNGGLASEVARLKSKIVYLNKIIPDVTVYHKICPRCKTIYRYQEWSQGIHNYNDSLLIGLDVCLFIRAGLLNHVAMGRTLAIIQEMIGTNLNVMDLEKAYLHFEAMTDREYDFHCVLCGYHPAIIIWDTFRKASFRHVVSDLESTTEDMNERVNLTNFWQQIESCIVKRGIDKGLAKQDEVMPNYGFWSPWIGKYSRKDDLVYNTEFKKCPSYSHDDIDECIPEETLVHLLMHEKVSAIKRVCRELGVKPEGSSVDMILKLRDLSVKKSRFDLAYEKVFGCTGGWAVGCCTHGVVYCIKNLLRCESPRDYIDMERGLKHRPTISISDVAHLMAKHGNKTTPYFYHPDEGRIVPVTEENIKLAEEKHLFNIACLKEKEGSHSSDDSNFNPTTGSKSHFSLFDWFHQDNCKKREEILRKSSLVAEIAGLVDTQAVEQLFSSSKRDLYFLNNLSPTNHLFIFRLICHLRNQRKNFLVNKRQQEMFGTLHQNEYGQVCGGVEVPSSNSYNSGPTDLEEMPPYSRTATSDILLNDSSQGNDYTMHSGKANIAELQVCASSIGSENDEMASSDPEIIIPTDEQVLVLTKETQSRRSPMDIMRNLHNKMCSNELFAQWRVLCEALQAALQVVEELPEDEKMALIANLNYANDVLFEEPGMARKCQVRTVNTKFGPFETQGFSNFCGLCAVNNAIRDFSASFAISDLNKIADTLWIDMLINPSYGVTQRGEPMRDKEGFYSVEVIRSALGSRGFEMIPLNPQSILGLTSSDVGQTVASTLQDSYGNVRMIIKPSDEQHWISIKEIEGGFLLMDSKRSQPRYLNTKEMGFIVRDNCETPGAVHFVFKTSNEILLADKTEEKSSKGATVKDKTQEMSELENPSLVSAKVSGYPRKERKKSTPYLHAEKTYDFRPKPKKRRKYSSFYYPEIGIMNREERGTLIDKEERRCEGSDDRNLDVQDTTARATTSCQQTTEITMDSFHQKSEQITNLSCEIINCSKKDCEEEDHRRHHHFIEDIDNFLQRERRNYGFGSKYIDVKQQEMLIKEILESFLIKKRTPGRIYSGWWMSITDLENDILENIFKSNILSAKDYIFHVLVKEMIIFLIMDTTGITYNMADDRCRSTEESITEKLRKERR